MQIIVPVTTTGGAGVATGTATAGQLVRGFVEAIKLDYSASAPATTDVTITEGQLGTTVLSKANSATDTVYYPQVLVCDTSGTNTTFYKPIYLDGTQVTITIAQCDALATALTVTFIIRELTL